MTPALLSLLAGLAVVLVQRWVVRGGVLARPHGARRALALGLLGGGAALLLARQVVFGVALAVLGLALWPRGGETARRSSVRSAMLEMTLDHATGAMDGRVLHGAFAGRLLSQMSLADLLRLAAGLDADDAETARLLASYLDRAHPGWRDGPGGDARGTARDGSRPASPGGMTRDEAYRILGLEPGADAAAIRAAHHRLMKRVHPDLGGSAVLAAQINAAKARLL